MLHPRFLALCLAVLVAGPARPDAVLSDADWLARGRSLLRDGFARQAEQAMQDLLLTQPEARVVAEAQLLIARSRYERQDPEGALRLLAPPPAGATNSLAHAYAYWTARLRFEAGEAEAALALVGDPLALSADEPYRIALARLKARCLALADRLDEAAALLERTGAEEKSSADALEGLLDLAAVYDRQQRGPELDALLQRVAEHPRESRARSEAQLWLATRRLLARDFQAAEEALQPLLNTNLSDRVVAARAYAVKAAIFETSGEITRALRTLETRETLLQGKQEIARSRLDRAQLMIKSGRLAEGAALLRKEIGPVSREARAARAQLLLAQAALAEELYPEAEKYFQEYLESFDDPDGLEEARLGKALALRGAGRPAEAAALLEKLARDARSPARREESLLLGADAHFVAGQFAEALTAYQRHREAFPESEAAGRAAFQRALCLLRLDRPDEALQAWAELAEARPDDPHAARALLQSAYVRITREEWHPALRLLDRLLADERVGSDLPEALHRRGYVRYRLGEIPAALADFEEVAARYPATASAEGATFMKGWCLYLIGRDEEALAICESFLSTYPQSAYAFDVLFWLAEYHYNHRDFPRALARFEEAAGRATAPDLAERAHFWAGRAAAQDKLYPEAIRSFDKVLKVNPASARRPEVLFHQADCLTLLGQFDAALVLFDEIVKQHARTYTALLAWGRKGDCLFTLGEQDPARFEQAILAYQGVLDAPDSPPDLRLQAGYKIARTWRRLNQSEKAIDHYLKVLHGFLDNRSRVGPEAEVWFTRAGFEAAEILEVRGEWRQAIALYRQLAEAGVNASGDAEARLQALRVERLILF
jgi:tetratricopeptide (TPR) repeat protein